MEIKNYTRTIYVEGEPVEEDVQVATYLGPEDKDEMDEKLGEGKLDGTNYIGRRRCFRKGWSFLLPKAQERPKVFRLVKDAIQVYDLQGDGEGSISTPVITIDGAGSVTITCSTADATIYYTTDGSDPDNSSSSYSDAFSVESGVTVKAIAYVEDQKSGIASKKYTATVATPVISPASGEVTQGTTASITCSTDGATIHYTTNGSTPTTSSEVFSTAIEITDGMRLRAIAVKENWTDSGVASADYTVAAPDTVAAPSFSPVAGSVEKNTEITITSATDGATIYYTTGSDDPDQVYSSPIAITENTTIKAVAKKDGMTDSAVKSAAYTVIVHTVANPSFSPAAGNIAKDATVTIECSTADATIYYTTGSDDPDQVYSSPIAISEDTIIKAVAKKTDWVDSSVVSAAYTVVLPKAAAPTISPEAGAVTIGTSVSISSSVPGAVIHYTDNGSTPTASSPVYSGEITIDAAKTIKAIVVADGYQNSDVASAAYTIVKVATPTFSPNPGSINKNDTVEISCATDGATIYYTTDGSNPTELSTEYTGAVTITETVTIRAIAIKDGYDNSSIASGAYTVVTPKVATPTFSQNGGNINIHGSVTISCDTAGATIYYTLDGTTPTTSSASGTTVTFNEAGSKTLKAIAVKADYENSEVKSATFTVTMPTCATPAFSPIGGEVESGSTVTLSCDTATATIYYTTDGSAPTSASTEYTTPIAITAAITIKAIAIAADYNNSPVASASYTVTAPVVETIRWYGLYNQTDDGDSGIDDEYKLTPSNISTFIEDTSWFDEWLYNAYNTAGNDSARVTGNTKDIGASESAQEPIWGKATEDGDVGVQVVYAYPAELGELTTMLENSFNMMNSFFHTTLTLEDNKQYLVYVLTSPTGKPSTYKTNFYFR